MFELKENGLWATSVDQDRLNQMLKELGVDGLHGAMFMHNFIAKQYQAGNVIPPERIKDEQATA